MAKIVVELDEKPTPGSDAPLSGYKPQKSGGRVFRVLGIFAGLLLLIGAIASIAGYFYWQNLKTTPQYSLALLVDAARRDDQPAIDDLVDTNAVIDSFVPQITNKAIELYGRGLSQSVLKRVASVAAPAMPMVKERARLELPKLLRERTKRFEKVPFFMMAAGADQFLDIVVEGDIARVSSKELDRPLELYLKRNGDRWKIVALKDEVLARRIAERIGQQIIALVKKSGTEQIDSVGRKIGLKNLNELLKKAGDIFK